MERINNIKNNEINVKNAYNYAQPLNGMPSLPLLALVVASSGCGKTTTVLNMLTHYKPCFEHIILISPTGTVDPESHVRLEPKYSSMHIDEEYNSFNADILEKIKKDQLDRLDNFRAYHKYMEIYHSWRRGKIITDDEILKLDERNFEEMPKPNKKIGMQFEPTVLLIFDDLYLNASQNKMLSTFIIKSRHYNCSSIILCQSISQMYSNVIRRQTNLWIVFPSSKKNLKAIYEEACNDITFEQFEGWFKDMDRCEFVLIDNKRTNGIKYRRNFNMALKV
jgi:hypothetical protein